MDTNGVDVQVVAEKVIDFLLARQVITANPRRDALLQPSIWAAGQGWLSVLQPHPEFWRHLVNNGVDVVLERELHHPLEYYEQPTCGGCHALLDQDVHHAALDVWLAGSEPTLSCRACGWSALVGDWPVTWAAAIGAPAVVFHNWPPLNTAFIAELRAVMGGRTQLVQSRC